MTSAPLLSVCVPTYQRRDLLRVMLQALLPQAAALGDLVEVCVADNASTDGTADVVADAMMAVPDAVVRLLRRPRNIGPVRNYIETATTFARGQFIWALGDDDLLLPGALERVCATLSAHRDLEFFYVNFASASFSEHWPASAHGGYAGVVQSVANTYRQDRRVARWQDLPDASSSMGTQVYAHIVARRVWVDFWHDRPIAPDYRTYESTYPHTAMLVEMAWDRPAYYLGTPALVQFNGRPGWGEGQVPRIVLIAMPQLIARLDDRGYPLHALTRALQYLKATTFPVFRALIAGEGGASAADTLRESLQLADRYPELIESLIAAINERQGQVAPEVIDVVRESLTRYQQRTAGAA